MAVLRSTQKAFGWVAAAGRLAFSYDLSEAARESKNSAIKVPAGWSAVDVYYRFGCGGPDWEQFLSGGGPEKSDEPEQVKEVKPAKEPVENAAPAPEAKGQARKKG